MSIKQKLLRKNILIIINTLLLIPYLSAVDEFLPAKEKDMCSYMGYINATNQQIMREKPTSTSTKVAILQPKQYVCIVNIPSINGWTFVIAVPDAYCTIHPSEEVCINKRFQIPSERSFPIVWLKEHSRTLSKCRAISLNNKDANYYEDIYPDWRYVGDCASGWIEDKRIITIEQ